MIPLLIAVATIVTSQQPPTNKQRYEQFLEHHHQRKIDAATKEHDRIQQSIIGIRKAKGSSKSKRNRIKYAQSQLKAAKKTLGKLNREKSSGKYKKVKPVICLPNQKSQPVGPDDGIYVGFIGAIYGGGEISGDGRSAKLDTHFLVMNVIDDDEMLIRTTHEWTREAFSDPALIRGISTVGLVTDAKVDLHGKFFEVVETWTYATAIGGTNTVFVLEPFDTTGFTP